MRPQLWPATLIAATFAVLAIIYSIVIPVFESPDEVWHYPLVWHLARTGELPVQDPARPQLWHQEGSQPPLYYLLAALLTWPIPADDLPELIYRNPHADIGLVTPDGNVNIVVHTGREAWPWSGAVLAVHIARLFSVLLGAGTVLAIYALGCRLWPEHAVFAPLMAAFVAFNPMFIFMSGSVNNDNLITFLASVTLWRLVSFMLDSEQIIDRPPAIAPVTRSGRITAGRLQELVTYSLLGILTGLAALSKVSGLGLVGLTGLTLLWAGWRQRSWRIVLVGNAVVGVLTLALAGWWYWRNFQLYGDWTGTDMMVAMMGARLIQPTWGQFGAELSGAVRSFWGLFGYFSAPMPEWVYAGLNLMFLGGIGGLLILPARWGGGRREDRKPGRLTQEQGRLLARLRLAGPVLLGWLIILLLGWVQWTLRTPASQGRLLFPALGVIAGLWATGWVTLIPRPWQVMPALAMLALAGWTPWGVIAPVYARPEAVAALPASAQPLQVAFGQTIHLLGYEIEQSNIQAGDLLAVKLYWQSTAPIPQDYTVFVHLLDEHDLVIAQRNLFHGPGVYPTSQWHPHRPFVDRYVLRLPNTAYAPAQARFEVGLYDHTTGMRLTTTGGPDSVRFGQIKLEPRPGRTPNPQQLRFENGMTLAGYDLSWRTATPGQTITLTLYWQTEAVPRQDYKVFVHLVGQGDTRIAQHDGEPGQGTAPTSSWRPGRPVIDEHPLTIAPEATPGAYRIVIGLYNGETGQRLRLVRDGAESVQLDSVTLSGVRVVQLAE